MEQAGGTYDLQKSLYCSFEEDCREKGLVSPTGARKWFAYGEKFSSIVRMSGFLVVDIHANNFPDAQQGLFIDDFSTTTCSQESCSRPAHIRSLSSAEHFKGFQKADFKVKTERIRKGYAIAELHPAINLICPTIAKPDKRPEELQPDACHLCVRHANIRVQSALSALVYWQLSAKRQLQPQLPCELMDVIIQKILSD